MGGLAQKWWGQKDGRRGKGLSGKDPKRLRPARWSNRCPLLRLSPPIQELRLKPIKRHHGTIFYRPACFRVGRFHSHHGAGGIGDNTTASRPISKRRAPFDFGHGELCRR